MPQSGDSFEHAERGDLIRHEEWNKATKRIENLGNIGDAGSVISTGAGTFRRPRKKGEKIYLAKVPCTEFLPAMSNGDPGSLECCMFYISEDGTEIRAVREGDHIKRREVFNIFPFDIGDVDYVQIIPVARNKWVALEPLESNINPTTTTTTTLDPSIPTTTTTTTLEFGAEVVPYCSGRCKWIWSVSNAEWTLATDGCSIATTTTTTTGEPTTTTTGEPTTTTTTCECPSLTTTTTTSTTSTTSTTTTSTTTTSTTTLEPTTTTTEEPADCVCLIPDFCGTVDGECVHTYCSIFQNLPPVCSGTTTTTTTCDCQTTTTSEPVSSDPEVNPCAGLWCGTECSPGNRCVHNNSCVDRFGTGAGQNIPLGVSCNCRPDQGEDESSEACGSIISKIWYPCAPNFTPPNVTPCSGNCQWGFSDDGVAYLISNGCSLASECQCNPPTQIPDDADCHTVVTPCSGPAVGCEKLCYTTTTEEPFRCLGPCEYAWNTGTAEWDLMSSNCGVCECEYPANDGAGDCDVERVKTGCGNRTTTTTDEPCSDVLCEWEWDGADWTRVDEMECSGTNCNCCYPNYEPNSSGSGATTTTLCTRNAIECVDTTCIGGCKWLSDGASWSRHIPPWLGGDVDLSVGLGYICSLPTEYDGQFFNCDCCPPEESPEGKFGQILSTDCRSLIISRGCPTTTTTTTTTTTAEPTGGCCIITPNQCFNGDTEAECMARPDFIMGGGCWLEGQNCGEFDCPLDCP